MDRRVFVGTYTDGTDSEGIYVCRLEEETGRLFRGGVVKDRSNPSFIAWNREKGLLCAVNEGEDRNRISVYRESEASMPRLIDSKEIPGEGPCHISMDSAGTRIFYANYVSGDIGMLRLNREGRFFPDAFSICHTGGSVGERQKGPHPHEVHLSEKEKLLLVPDLGTDEIIFYDISGDKPRPISKTAVRPGDGPRHLAEHPGGRWLYLICEIENAVYVFQKAKKGQPIQMQRISLMDGLEAGAYIAGEIAVTADGRYLVTSTRAWGSKRDETGYLSVFPVAADGTLGFPRHFPSGGCHPRMFSITEDDKFILTANQYSGNLASFRLDQRSGTVELCDTMPIPGAACVLCG